MELLQLQYFRELARNGHLSKTAEALHIAQPSLSQTLKRLESEIGVPLFDRVGNRIVLNDSGRIFLKYTDEIFAVASSKRGSVGQFYMYGLILLPVLGWVGGTLTGAIASTVMPAYVRSALGVALYGMFIAIVVPPAKKESTVRTVVFIALALSSMFYYLPVLKQVSGGFMIIICTLLAAGIGAVLFPIKEDEEA